MRHLLITLLSLLGAQFSLAHEAPLNAVGCHLQRSSNVHHCHEGKDFQRKVRKNNAFSGHTAKKVPKKRYEVKLVKAIQQQLTLAGYNVGPADGVYGGKTREAILSFQKKNAFKVTGRPSEYVLSKLRDFNRLN